MSYCSIYCTCRYLIQDEIDQQFCHVHSLRRVLLLNLDYIKNEEQMPRIEPTADGEEVRTLSNVLYSFPSMFVTEASD